MTQVLLFVEREFSRGRRTQLERSCKFQGVERDRGKGKWEILGMRGQTGQKNLHEGGGGMDISWNHTFYP